MDDTLLKVQKNNLIRLKYQGVFDCAELTGEDERVHGSAITNIPIKRYSHHPMENHGRRQTENILSRMNEKEKTATQTGPSLSQQIQLSTNHPTGPACQRNVGESLRGTTSRCTSDTAVSQKKRGSRQRRDTKTPAKQHSNL